MHDRDGYLVGSIELNVLYGHPDAFWAMFDGIGAGLQLVAKGQDMG